jgi:hypothetical protein
MVINGSIHHFPKEIKALLIAFIITLSIGFYSGISFVRSTTDANPSGIEERYLGNENNEQATKMKFKKSEGEIMTTVHSHILSLSVIFFILALCVATTDINQKLKLFLMIEPFLSLVFTFGGIYFLWKEITWMKYVIMVSGFLMTTTYTLSVFLVLKQLVRMKKS